MKINVIKYLTNLILLCLIVISSSGTALQSQHPHTEKKEIVNNPHDHTTQPLENMALEGTNNYTDGSIYQVESTWLNEDGEKMAFGELRGRVQVLSIIYTSCQYACPRIVSDMKRIESLIPENEKQKVGFVLISMDPDRDTPEKLKKYSIKMELNSHQWTLMHGNDQDVMEAANLLGVRYKKTSTGDFSHSNIISVLNQEGEILSQQNGLGTDPSKTIETIKKAIAANLFSIKQK